DAGDATIDELQVLDVVVERTDVHPYPFSWTGGTPSAHHRALHRHAAPAGASAGQAWDHGEDQLAHSGDVLREDAQHLFVGHRRDALLPLESNVVVGNQGDVGVAELQLARQNAFRVLGHVDHLPALAGVPPALGAGGETRPTTTTVPPSWTARPSSRAASSATRRISGQ